jgi:hypothetical protein
LFRVSDITSQGALQRQERSILAIAPLHVAAYDEAIIGIRGKHYNEQLAHYFTL